MARAVSTTPVTVGSKVSLRFPWAAVLFTVFLVAKLAGWVTWSWWWVAAPLWIPAGFAAAAFIVLGVIAWSEERSGR